jgi:hypothetical protein
MIYKKSLSIILLVLSFSSCKKEEDYRLKYIGTFNTILYYVSGNSRPDSAGNYYLYNDTTSCFTIVSLDLDSINKIKILFPSNANYRYGMTDNIGNFLSCSIDNYGAIKIPIKHYGHQFFEGSLKYDSLNIISGDGSLGGGFSYVVQGIKLK